MTVILVQLGLIYLASTMVKTQAVPKLNVVLVGELDYDTPKAVVAKAFNALTGQLQTEVELAHHQVNIGSSDTESKVCSNIMKVNPHVMIDVTLRPNDNFVKTSSIVKKIARDMGIPTVSATYGRLSGIKGWERLNETELMYLVQIPPPGDYMLQVIRDIAILQKMKSAGILYDSSVVMEHKFSTLLENVQTRHMILSVDGTMEDLKKRASDLDRSDIDNFFIVGTTETLTNALSTAQENKMYGREFAWFLISKEEKEQNTKPSCACINITALYIYPEPTDLTRVKMLNENQLTRAYPMVDTAFYYDLTEMTLRAVADRLKSSKWPETLSYPKCGEVMNSKQLEEREKIDLSAALQQESFDGAYGRFVINQNGKNYQELKLLFETIKIENDKAPERNKLATWTYGKPSGIVMEANIPPAVLDVYSAVTVYRVTTVVQPPFVMKREYADGRSPKYYGYCIDLIDEIKEILKFDYIISEAPDKMFGAMNEKNEWNGMIKELIDQKADIALAPLSVMAERETVVDFTVPYYDLVGISILMKKPQVPSSLFKFLTVLETNVWGCILAAYFFTSLLMYLFDRLSPYSFHNNSEKYKNDDEKRDFNIKECMWFCMTSLTPQGGGEAPRNLSGRLVAATWWLFGFIIIASYTANLAAFLTVSRLDSPIESLDDLAKQYKIKYAPQKGTSSMTYFERMAHIEEKFYEIWKNMSLNDDLNDTERAKLAVWDYPVSDKYTKIWWTMQETEMPTSFKSGVRRVKESQGSQEGFAFIADSTQVKYATMTNCDLEEIGNEFSRKPLALAVQQGSPLKDQLSSAILKLLNQRKLEGLKEKWWNKNTERVTCEDSDRQSDGISIENIGGVFIVIFIGVVLACITLAIEYWYYKQKRMNTKVVAIKQYPGKETKKY
ncbi:ionotropic receptor 25a isoform X2 [Tachypleus tridentatus]